MRSSFLVPRLQLGRQAARASSAVRTGEPVTRARQWRQPAPFLARQRRRPSAGRCRPLWHAWSSPPPASRGSVQAGLDASRPPGPEGDVWFLAVRQEFLLSACRDAVAEPGVPRRECPEVRPPVRAATARSGWSFSSRLRTNVPDEHVAAPKTISPAGGSFAIPAGELGQEAGAPIDQADPGQVISHLRDSAENCFLLATGSRRRPPGMPPLVLFRSLSGSVYSLLETRLRRPSSPDRRLPPLASVAKILPAYPSVFARAASAIYPPPACRWACAAAVNRRPDPGRRTPRSGSPCPGWTAAGLLDEVSTPNIAADVRCGVSSAATRRRDAGADAQPFRRWNTGPPRTSVIPVPTADPVGGSRPCPGMVQSVNRYRSLDITSASSASMVNTTTASGAAKVLAEPRRERRTILPTAPTVPRTWEQAHRPVFQARRCRSSPGCFEAVLFYATA